MTRDAGTVTPYSTIVPANLADEPTYVPEEDRERIVAYQMYNNLYWSENRAVELVRDAEDGDPLYVPRPKMIVDTTAHYLLKGLTIGLEDPEKYAELNLFLQGFLDREAFLARFNTAKIKGVALGDWVFHITADPLAPELRRISLTTVDPAAYFPEYHPDDGETRIGVRLMEPFYDPLDPQNTLVKVLHYFYDWENPNDRKVWREEAIWEVKDWWIEQKAKLHRITLPLEPLPEDITEIPVYHFRNSEWDGYLFGNSELKGVEGIFRGIDQAISDEEIALALVGLGVYATDAGRPTVNGREVDWVVSPGTVLEVPGATMIKRLEGITTVTPVQDHLKYLDSALKEATGTSDIALGVVDAQTAESGIALAIKFIPTLAKIEYRDQSGMAKLTQMWYDLTAWFRVFEGVDFGEVRILPRIGEKLPVNASAVMNELNNLFDRKIISAQFYRDEFERKLGYRFPEDIQKQILDEQRAQLQLMQEQMAIQQAATAAQQPNPRDPDNNSNNRNRVNESNGSEANSGSSS